MNRLIAEPDQESGVRRVKLHQNYAADMGEIVMCIPKVRDGDKVKFGTQLISFETTRCLSSARSPLSGSVIRVAEERVFTNPTDITEDTVFFWIRENDALSSV